MWAGCKDPGTPFQKILAGRVAGPGNKNTHNVKDRIMGHSIKLLVSYTYYLDGEKKIRYKALHETFALCTESVVQSFVQIFAHLCAGFVGGALCVLCARLGVRACFVQALCSLVQAS